MIDALPLLLSPEGYQISRSVRLRASANAYLQRTNATTGTDPLKFTVSAWVKKGNTVELPILGSATGTAAFDFVGFWTGDTFTFRIRNSSTVDLVQLISTAVFRDYSAWYHLVAIYDSANATSTERVKLYVNGVQLTSFSTATYPSLNQGLTGDFLTDMQIGRTNTNSSNQNYGDGYLTEINFIDGQALTPASFGETNPVTGVWQPKKYTGTYGTNGFYLNFSDNSAATAAAIGKDYSGNGNNWTPNNISLTAGVTYDSMLDVPTQWADGGNGRGNYPTFNPLKMYSGNFGFAQGNLQASDNSSVVTMASATMRTPTTGKWYWEITATTISGSLGYICATSEALADAITPLGYGTYRSNGGILNIAGTAQTSGTAYTSGDVIGVAVDVDAGTVQFYKNNTAQGATPSFSFTAGTSIVPAVIGDNAAGTKTFHANFGQRPFDYTPPTGFKALNTLNLPTPTILKGNQYFDASLWTGDQSARTITNSGGFQPDFLWTKSRSFAEGHRLSDAVRGGNGTVLRTLSSNSTDAEAFDTDVTGFTSSGFNIRAGTNTPNVTGRTYVGWQWKEGATQGFDIVTYTGDGTSPRNISHNLGVTPAMVIVKSRNAVASWMVKHKNLSTNNNLFLETNGAQSSPSNGYIQDLNNSSTFGVVNGGGGVANINGSGTTYVAYLFAEVAGFSKFGSYTGNASADGPFVFCGFRPRFIMFKSTATGNNWLMFDTARNTSNLTQNKVAANVANPENDVAISSVSENNLDILSNGFKLRTINAQNNGSGATIIFAAFAENPFKNALAR